MADPVKQHISLHLYAECDMPGHDDIHKTTLHFSLNISLTVVGSSMNYDIAMFLQDYLW